MYMLFSGNRVNIRHLKSGFELTSRIARHRQNCMFEGISSIAAFVCVSVEVIHDSHQRHSNQVY